MNDIACIPLIVTPCKIVYLVFSGQQSLSKFVYFEGWLEKQGSKVKNWKKRWFVLHQPPGPGQNFTLKYYTNDKKSAEKVWPPNPNPFLVNKFFNFIRRVSSKF